MGRRMVQPLRDRKPAAGRVWPRVRKRRDIAHAGLERRQNALGRSAVGVFEQPHGIDVIFAGVAQQFRCRRDANLVKIAPAPGLALGRLQRGDTHDEDVPRGIGPHRVLAVRYQAVGEFAGVLLGPAVPLGQKGAQSRCR